MAFRSGALRAFHHQVGYAYRRLRQDCPVMSAHLLRALRKLQTEIARLCLEVAEVETKGHGAPSGRIWISRCPDCHKALQQHDTDETCYTKGGETAISDTESWTDATSLLENVSTTAHRRHCRKPRTDRRAKHLMHQQEFAQQVAFAARDCTVAGGSRLHARTALLECLAEDLGLGAPDTVQFDYGHFAGDGSDQGGVSGACF